MGECGLPSSSATRCRLHLKTSMDERERDMAELCPLGAEMTNTSTSEGRVLRHAPEIAIAVVILALLVLCALTYRDYGFTIDEQNGLWRANNIVKFYLSGGEDSAELTAIRPENFYGAMTDVIALWLQRWFPGLGLDSRHLVSALFGIVGVYYTYRLGDFLGGKWAGVAGGAFLALTPIWIGYSYFNFKDIPFGAALVASSFYGLKVMSSVEKPRWPTLVGLAIWCGALGTSKLTGVLLLGFAVLVLLAFWLVQHGWPTFRVLFDRAMACAGLGILGIIIFSIAFWPQLFLYSPVQTFKAVTQFLNYDPWHGNVLLGGAFFDQDHIPHEYLATYIIITTPLLILATYIASMPASILNKQYAVLGAAALPAAFVAIQWVTDAQIYNGSRQFLFVLPFMCAAAGYGLVALSRIGNAPWARYATIGVFAVFAGWIIYTWIALFPYQYSAYNLLVGGIQGAENRYYIDVWRSAQREALQKINDSLPNDGQRYRVLHCGSPLDFVDFPRLDGTRDPRGHIDYALRIPRCSLENPSGFTVIGEVRRQGVLFAAILKPEGSLQVPPEPQ